MSDDKKQIMVYATKDDAEFFQKIQKEHKAIGIGASNVFKQFVQAYKKERGIDNV